MTNTTMLQDRIHSSGYRLSHIANRLGLSRYGLYRKIRNESEFTASEIDGLCGLLGIDRLEDRFAIFFAGRVD